MKRTRKWAYVEQEAKRLAELGLTPLDISKRLGLSKSTVTRWIQAGKLTRKRPYGVAVEAGQTPGQWAAEVRKSYALDATDEQLVGMAEAVLLVTRDPDTAPQIRLQAMGRFQALVKQLALVARLADATAPVDAPKRQSFHVARRPAGDPRTLLTAVK